MTGSRFFAEALRGYGVTHVFFVPAILPEAMAAMDDTGVTRILTHGETAAGYMADGYARASGKPGVCLAQSVGAANLAAGIRDAYLASSPVIAISGGPHPDTRYRHLYQVNEDFPMFGPITKFNARVDHPRRLPDILRQAFRMATSGAPGPVHLEISGRHGESMSQEPMDFELFFEEEFSRLPGLSHRAGPGRGRKSGQTPDGGAKADHRGRRRSGGFPGLVGSGRACRKTLPARGHLAHRERDHSRRSSALRRGDRHLLLPMCEQGRSRCGSRLLHRLPRRRTHDPQLEDPPPRHNRGATRYRSGGDRTELSGEGGAVRRRQGNPSQIDRCRRNKGGRERLAGAHPATGPRVAHPSGAPAELGCNPHPAGAALQGDRRDPAARGRDRVRHGPRGDLERHDDRLHQARPEVPPLCGHAGMGLAGVDRRQVRPARQAGHLLHGRRRLLLLPFGTGDGQPGWASTWWWWSTTTLRSSR